jgi:hypothetical protein
MKDNPESQKNVLVARFHRKGGAGSYTMPFDELPTESQQELLAMSSLNENELPIIASFLDKEHWLLITTKRVIWFKGEELHYLDNDNIDDATADLSVESWMNVRKKTELANLVIFDSSGNKHILEIEPGNSYFAVLNVLKYL